MTGQILVSVGVDADEFGQLVIRHLLDRLPADRVVALAGTQESATSLAGLGVEVRVAAPGDLAYHTTFGGVGTVLVVATSGRDGYGAGPPDDGIIRIDAAAAGGADRIVYATFASETWWEHPGESTLDSTGLRYTVLRNNLHSECLLPAFAVAREHGEFVCAFGDGLLAPAARSDCAETTAVVLTGDGHDFQRYQLGGPIGLKPLGIASVMSRLADREITAREVTPAELVDELVRAGAPAGTAAELARLHGIIWSGGTGTPGTVLPALLGRYPLSLEEALRARLGDGGRRALPDRPGPHPTTAPATLRGIPRIHRAG